MTGRIPLLVSVAVLAAAALSAAACMTAGGGPHIVQPGAPGESSRVIDGKTAADLSKIRHTEADVQFMQGMIGHHAQALEMAALLPSRTSREEMKLLAKRIEVSQADEIKMMQQWLESRGESVPAGAHARHDHRALMPGMLTPEEMSRLASAKGIEFDRLFLEFMIKHHDGALIMVKELFAKPGAAQASDVYAFASDVDADQRMEIERMSAMLFQLKEREE